MKKKYSLSKKLVAYSAFASAFLAAKNNVDAQILYTDVNPDDTLVIADNYSLDLNNDGLPDYKFNLFKSDSGYVNYARVVGYNSNLISRDVVNYYSTFHTYYYANALSAGDVIGGAASFKHQEILASNWPYYIFGNWVGVNDRFLGLKLFVNSNVYYGWIRLSISANVDTMIVSDYAVDTVANDPLIAGDLCGDYSVYANTVINAPDPVNLCSGDSVALMTDSLQGFTYQWYLGNNAISGATTFNYSTDADGTYSVVVTNNYGCIDTSSAIQVIVFPLPVAPVITQLADTLTSTAAVSYQWYYNNVAIPGATNQSYSTNQSGIYTVQITDANGCTALSNSYTFYATGILDMEDLNVIIFEEEDNVVVQLKDKIFLGGQLKIFNVSGIEIYNAIVKNQTLSIDLKQLESGVYLLTIENKGRKVVRKVVV